MAPSLAESLSTYDPGCAKLAVVAAADASQNDTFPGPFNTLQPTVIGFALVGVTDPVSGSWTPTLPESDPLMPTTGPTCAGAPL